MADVSHLLEKVRTLSGSVESLTEGAARLRQIRATVYENLNQIQHEYLIIRALGWLQLNGFGGANLSWSWNPRQTGDASELDLQARSAHEVVVSAEATTSEKPDGVIDSRMRNTLAKLSDMPGRKYYFVHTGAMAQRARTKAARNSWPIQVVQLDDTAV